MYSLAIGIIIFANSDLVLFANNNKPHRAATVDGHILQRYKKTESICALLTMKTVGKLLSK